LSYAPEPAQVFGHLRRVFCITALWFLVSVPALSQQPFVTDDADVTPKGRFHFEFSNEFDLLQRDSFPSLKQNTADIELDYGLFESLEIGVAAPLLTIINDAGTTPRRVTGIGDLNISLKYNFLREQENSRRPALAIAFNLELPTGDTERQLGSGLADVYINGILQKSLTKRTKLRFNGGVLFSGNETTGALGIKSRGTVLTAGGSLVRQFSPKLQLGIELTGARSTDLQLGKKQLQTLMGGNYQLSQKLSFDFAVLGGKYAASPRAGVQLGISVDF
jgi:hypothetical protein